MRAPFSFIKPNGSVATVSAVSYPYADVLGGGQRVVVTVNSSTGCTAISAGGVAFTSFAIDDGTHVSGIPGAHAAGVVDVVVTNAAGPSTTGTGLVEYFDPTSIVDLYLDGTQYAVGTWTARKGANATEATNKPTVGATLGGRASVDFNGTTQILTGANLSNYATTTQHFAFCLFQYDTISTNNGTTVAYTNGALWCDTVNDYTGWHLRSSPALQVYGFDTTGRADEATIAASTWTAGLGKFDGTKMYSRLGSGAWSAGSACATLAGTLANPIRLGSNYNATAFFDGRIAVLAIAQVIPSDANVLKLLGVINQQWGTAF